MTYERRLYDRISVSAKCLIYSFNYMDEIEGSFVDVSEEGIAIKVNKKYESFLHIGDVIQIIAKDTFNYLNEVRTDIIPKLTVRIVNKRNTKNGIIIGVNIIAYNAYFSQYVTDKRVACFSQKIKKGVK